MIRLTSIRMRMMVKWLSCAALFTLHSSLFTVLTSCSDDFVDWDQYDYSYGDRLFTRGYSPEQIKSQHLGYGFDAAGNIMSDSSFSQKPVINMDRLLAAEKTLGLIINSERRHYTSMDIFSGNTLQELGHEETKYTLDDSEAMGSGKYYRNDSTTYKGHWKNTYKAHMFIKHIMATRTIDAGLLHCLKIDSLDNEESVLEADFRLAVRELVKNGEGGVDTAKAVKFAEQYGTHLIVSSNLGGMIELQMEINRDSCVDRVYTAQKVIEVILGEKVMKTGSSKVISEVSKDSIGYEGQINVKGGRKEDCDLMHRTFDEKKAAIVKISDADYYEWANHLTIEADTSYNAAFIGGRFIPLYELFEDLTTRRALRKAYEMYLKKEAPEKEVDEPPYGVMPVKGNYGQDVRVAMVDSSKSCIICQEYVPSIRSDKPCIVAYPLIRGDDNNLRPFLYTGLFVGDEDHRPGRVIWEGSASVYTPSDSIFFESDSVNIRNLFDQDTHALKNVYFYWNAVHALPCPTATDSLKNYTTTIFKAQPEALAEPTTFAKVASTFWSVRPIVPKNDSLLKFWQEDIKFVDYANEKYNDYGGTVYRQADNKNYYFCLVDGGDLIKRAPVRTNDNDGRKQWTDAVSMSVRALELDDYLPTVEQSKSITKMLGNRMSIFYTHEFNGRNMLGLDWPTGYWVRSHPSQEKMAVNFTKNDGQGMPVITSDVKQARIMRLSGSGTDLLLEYPEYVSSFNYSDQMFFKYFPIYITISEF